MVRLLAEVENPRGFKRAIPMVSHFCDQQYHAGKIWIEKKKKKKKLSGFKL